MRGLLMFLVLITIVVLGLAGCPKDDAATSGAKPMTPLGESSGDTTSTDTESDGGE